MDKVIKINNQILNVNGIVKISDANLVPENIKEDIEILGVTGTYEGTGVNTGSVMYTATPSDYLYYFDNIESEPTVFTLQIENQDRLSNFINVGLVLLVRTNINGVIRCYVVSKSSNNYYTAIGASWLTYDSENKRMIYNSHTNGYKELLNNYAYRYCYK